MAASDPHLRSDRLPAGEEACPTPAALEARLDEEIGRAERHGSELGCLLVVIDNLDEISREHGSELREQTLTYVASALRRELRRFDRIGRGREGDLLIILPGADSSRSEIVARRVLERLRTIKVEARGARRALHTSVGLAAWREGASARALLASARAALRSVNGENGISTLENASVLPDQPSESARPRAQDSPPPAFRRAGGS
jgi:diguanylate cyclase (GGDEF)-like protein